jgi:transmembrane sensor
MSGASPRLVAEIRAEAADWLISFSEGEVDARSREEFNAWLRTSPEHVRAYLQIAAFWQAADRIEPAAKRDIDALVELARAEANVTVLAPSRESTPPGREAVPLGRESAPLGRESAPLGREAAPLGREAALPARGGGRFGAKLRIRFAAVAATVVIGLAGAWLFSMRDVYATGVGEHRTITLQDGSTVTLNAMSRLRVRFNRVQRRVELASGEALFRIAKDAARPFIVHSEATRIQVLGTQFNVNQRRSGTIVTVVEGRVSVAQDGAGNAQVSTTPQGAAAQPSTRSPAPLILSAGEQAVVRSARIEKRQPPNPASATAWNEGLLVFDSASLAEVTEEFNRQNVKPLLIEDPALGELQISGIFPATGSARLTEFLRARFGVVVTETEADIRLSTP